MSEVNKPLVLNRAAIGNSAEHLAAALAVKDEFRKELMREIEELDLLANVAELDIQGYTIIKNAAPLEFFQELREHIMAMSDERQKNGTYGDARGVFSDTILNCVGKGRVFEEAVLNRKLNAIMAYLLGDGYVLNATNAIVVEQGSPALPLHSDNAYVPAPFPSYPVSATSVWVTEDLDAESGASRVVPGSHKNARQPMPGEREDDAIAIPCPAGSIVVWNGATWHGNCGRHTEGKRVTFHTSCVLMHMRTFANNDAVPQDVVDRNPPLMGQLLGRGLPHGREGDGGPIPALRQIAGRLSLRRL